MHEPVLTLHSPCVQETPMKHPPTRDLGKTWHRPFLPGVFQAVCDNSSLLNCLGREHCQTRGTIRGVSREMGCGLRWEKSCTLLIDLPRGKPENQGIRPCLLFLWIGCDSSSVSSRTCCTLRQHPEQYLGPTPRCPRAPSVARSPPCSWALCLSGEHRAGVHGGAS